MIHFINTQYQNGGIMRLTKFIFGILLFANYAITASASALPGTITLKEGGAPFACDKKGRYLFLSDYGQVLVYDLQSQKTVKTIELEGVGTPEQIYCTNNKVIVLANSKIFVIDAEKYNIIKEIKLPGDSYIVSVPQNASAVYVIIKGVIHGYNTTTSKEIFNYKFQRSDTSNIQVSLDGRFLVFYRSSNNCYSILDIKTKKVNTAKVGDYSSINTLAIAPNSKAVYVMTDEGITVFNIKGKRLKTVKNSDIYSDTILFSPNGKYLLIPQGMTQKPNNTIGILDVKRNRMLSPLHPPLEKGAVIHDIIMLPDNNTIIFMSNEKHHNLTIVKLKK